MKKRYTKAEAEKEYPREIEAVEQSISMPTTGNEEQDEAILHNAAVTQVMLLINKCPNECGDLDIDFKSRTQTCPACGFSYQR